MLKFLAPTLLLGSILVAGTLIPRAANAGGVIIDGRVDDSVLPADDDSDCSSCSSTQRDDRDRRSHTLSEDEQAVFLFASMVFNGHDATTSKLTGSGSTGDGTTAEIIDTLEESDVQGGCAGTPVSGLAALVALGLLRRRRR